ncbi:Integrase catalytic domain-containing protein [Abeliophyllum distichum]|uniref:Integrase catalytic domain-containing protein n=1 Tax=Abeliophyllum distichum TaxID=126358 RepID=A0ABD1T0C4_9LAMI
MNEPLSSKFKEPIDEFNGTTDPIDHICTFQDRVRLHGWPDTVACRAFPMTLKKDAREWFDTLRPRSITSFVDFANKFEICFSSSARKEKTSMRLMLVTQQRGEPLQEYISQFNRVTLGIRDLQMSSVITELLNGLRNQVFKINSIGSSSRFSQPITFDYKDLLGISFPYDDALVITGDIADFDVKRALVDTESAANVLSWNTFKELKISTDRLKPINTSLLGFGRATTIEAYVDDMVVNSDSEENHVNDLREVFRRARHNRLKFNPEKCIFGTIGRKVLGFMVSQRGIEENPDKRQAIMNMTSLTNKKEVQRLT